MLDGQVCFFAERDSDLMSKSIVPGAGRADETGRQSRRKWIRHLCGSETTCRIIVESKQNFWAVEVQNISPGGINLVLDRIIPAGKLLTLELHRKDGDQSFQRQARVTYLFRNSEGRYVMGAAFSWELSLEELGKFI